MLQEGFHQSLVNPGKNLSSDDKKNRAIARQLSIIRELEMKLQIKPHCLIRKAAVERAEAKLRRIQANIE